MKTQRLKQIENALWKIIQAEDKRAGEGGSKDPVVSAIREAWGVAYTQLRTQLHDECEAADAGRVNWEVFMPGGRHEIGTPTRHIVHFASGGTHEYFTPTEPGDIRFRSAMGHFDAAA